MGRSAAENTEGAGLGSGLRETQRKSNIRPGRLLGPRRWVRIKWEEPRTQGRLVAQAASH